MESRSNTKKTQNHQIVLEEIKYPGIITSIDYNSQVDLFAAGDKNCRLTFFDLRQKKALKFIKANLNDEIKYQYFYYIHIKFSIEGNLIFFSCKDSLNFCDLRMDKLIYKEGDYTTMLMLENEESILKLKEINDVRLILIKYSSLVFLPIAQPF